ncbi:uncharacterized protein EV420DRAFT_1559022 [Desarmillaria tabescens]|uniref:Uncharacterized protein n=1 Tax=Armillaria tabescens TaxID=1929756 RepID=A0AA39MZ92_ARMTA|nr:uncharacterized protein EV420DRAFT_1559022 [Desarmillaria tabescens]KAK0452132.1 hypothetical protein EV420DRAFT_1559022 [Desarmillaria tabescens]
MVAVMHHVIARGAFQLSFLVVEASGPLGQTQTHMVFLPLDPHSFNINTVTSQGPTLASQATCHHLSKNRKLPTYQDPLSHQCIKFKLGGRSGRVEGHLSQASGVQTDGACTFPCDVAL